MSNIDSKIVSEILGKLILLLDCFCIHKTVPKGSQTWSQNGSKMLANCTPWALLAAPGSSWALPGACWRPSRPEECWKGSQEASKGIPETILELIWGHILKPKALKHLRFVCIMVPCAKRLNLFGILLAANNCCPRNGLPWRVLGRLFASSWALPGACWLPRRPNECSVLKFQVNDIREIHAFVILNGLFRFFCIWTLPNVESLCSTCQSSGWHVCLLCVHTIIALFLFRWDLICAAVFLFAHRIVRCWSKH